MCKINKNIGYAINKLQERVKLEKNETGIFISRDCIVTDIRYYNIARGDYEGERWVIFNN